jgi:predicted aminopeptidase
MIQYGLQQLQGQLSIVWNTRTISEVLKDTTTTDSIKVKLKLIEDIKRYAVDSLGLKESDNYSTFYDQKGKPSLWVLTATEPFKMKAYEWWFPFLGTTNYKGYFEKEIGLEAEEEIRKKGFDTDLGIVGAWSTLGFFSDPVLSNMLRRNEGKLAELIIHELTHGTLYIKGNVDFNENLATFIGEKGARQFLENKYGKESIELTKYQEYQEDEERYGEIMVKATKSLDSIYNHLDIKASKREIYEIKYRFIAQVMLKINQTTFHHKNRYLFDFKKDKLPNNCEFMAYYRYRKQQNEFKKRFDTANVGLKQFIQKIKSEND